MVDLPGLAQRLQKDGLIAKSFTECTKSEILQIVEAVFSAVGDDVPPDGWSKPRLEDNSLIIPHDVHPDYHWWNNEGKSIYQILIELDAPFEVAKKYICRGMATPMTEKEWLDRLIPF